MTSLTFGLRVEALQRALNVEDARRASQAARSTPPPPTVAISRQAGSNASAIAKLVGERLGWPVYDRELIDQIAEQMKLNPKIVQAVDEHRSHWLTDLLESFSSKPGVNEIAYLRRLRPVLQSLATRGECVIVGRGAAQVLPAETTLRVRLVGPLEGRVAAMRERFGYSEEEARHRVAELDDHRTRFVRDYFFKDPDDPGLYDLALNVCRLSAEDCAKLIVAGLDALRGGRMLAEVGRKAVAQA